jgi:hypothetical protein
LAYAAVLLAPALALLVPALAAAQAVSIQLTATDVFDPMNVFGSGPVGAFTSPGTVTCPGAQPTGNPVQPCPPGSRMNVRDASWMSRVTSFSELLTGWFYYDGNADDDANATGPQWGTFRIELDAGGVWEGSWTGDRNKVGDLWVVRVRGVGRGSGGSVDGMHLRFTNIAPMPNFLAVVWLGSMDAQILAPPRR